MPTQKTDLNTTWNINTDNDTWTLSKNATISTESQDGIYVGNGFTGNTIRVLGDVVTTGALGSAINIVGHDNKLIIGADSRIDGSDVNVGVNIGGADTTVTNAGVIKGLIGGVTADIATTLNNSGRIEGGWAVTSQFADFEVNNSGKIIGDAYGVRVEGDNADISNLKGGTISADTAVAFFDGEDGKLTSFGKIIGDISGGNGETSIVNRGVIKGDIALGDGVDRIDTRKGTIEGLVDGGDGGDTFLVSSQTINIVEQESGTGMDNVRSTVTFTLADNLETLTLLGKKDIDGTGNSGGNTLRGNSGDNVLRGLHGDDSLDGGKGNDLLIGGTGADVFEFDLKAGKDVIKDFENGSDLISSDFITNESDFNDMVANHLKVKGDDLLITYGDDTMLIKNMDKADLDFADFINI